MGLIADVVMYNSPQQYRPPALPTYAQRRAEKERQLAIAAGQLAAHGANENDASESKQITSDTTGVAFVGDAASHNEYVPIARGQARRHTDTRVSWQIELSALSPIK